MINAKTFCSALKFAAHAMAVSDIRTYLNGVRIEFHVDSLVLVGCNGAQLGSVTIGAPTYASGEYIVAGSSVKQILSLFGKDKADEITFSTADKRLVISSSSGLSITPALIDGHYPAWRRILPHSSRETGPMPQLNPNLLADACKAMAPLCRSIKGTPSVRFKTAGEGQVVAIHPLIVADPFITNVVALIQPTRV